MRQIRLGVIFDQKINVGGGYQQALNAALLAQQLPKELAQVIFFTTLKENIEPLEGYGIQAELIHLSFFAKAKMYIRKYFFSPRILKFIKHFQRYSLLEKKLINHKIDLVYFLSPTSLPQSLEELNYITTVWDLCHRDNSEFPEVRWNRELENRDKNYRAILPRAAAIFVDHEFGKQNVVHRYGLDEHRVYIMPFQAAEATRRQPDLDHSVNSVNIHAKYQLYVPYIFYPAQFWAHKNHVYLLEGLRTLEQRYGKLVGAIFSGGDKGNCSYVKSYVHKLRLDGRIRFAGFVSNEEIVDLYRQSIALVMPSYFGPTNLPPLEAFQLQVPVLYSDKASFRDQVGDAALLMDLQDPESMAMHLNNLIEDKHLRGQLIAAGRERLKYLDSYDQIGVWQTVIEDFRWKRLCWE